MLLREMTSSALAHSFKRFARCAVAGLALAGLAGCPGGGGGDPEPTPPTPAPTPAPTPTPTPTPTPPPPEMKIEPPEGVSPDTLNDWNECVTSYEVGTPQRCTFYPSRWAYSVTVTNQCSEEIDVISDVQSAADGWVWGGAVSLIDPGERRVKEEALCPLNDTQRLRYCVAPSDEEHEDFGRCDSTDATTSQLVESFSPPTAPPTAPSPAPAATTYGALYWGREEGVASFTWAFGSGTSASEAERDAERECERLSRIRGICEVGLRGYANACGVIAVSECPSQRCVNPASASRVDVIQRDAEAQAIRACETTARIEDFSAGTCRVATGRERYTRELSPGVHCVGTARQQ